MTFVGWGGSDPDSLPDDADYELGTQQSATTGIIITHVRVYGASTGTALANRKGRIWSMGGAVLATADLPSTLPLGWNLFELETPVAMNPGDSWVVSYSAIGGYGAEVHALDTDVPSANGDINCPAGTNGRLNFTPGQFPSVGSNNGAFFGIDIGFDEAGVSPPSLDQIVTDVTNLSVSATAVASDEEGLTGATYTFDWGDGTSASSGASNTANHTYASAGLYALLATVTDTTGLSDAAAVPLSLTAPVTPGSLPPTSELVARAWVAGVTGLPAGKVAMTLPKAEQWGDTGFIRINVVGGSPDPDIAERAPVVQIECWAFNSDSSKPPWGKANNLAELIAAETWKRDHTREVNPGSGYALALVQTATILSEPRRVPSDVASYALIQFDLLLRWRDA